VDERNAIPNSLLFKTHFGIAQLADMWLTYTLEQVIATEQENDRTSVFTHNAPVVNLLACNKQWLNYLPIH